MISFSHVRRAFNLVELLIVLAIISALAALLFPVFWTARGKARDAVCSSNLRQIGLGIAMYQQDYDGKFPYASDPINRVTAALWTPYFPQYAADIPQMPLLPATLTTYIKTAEVFHCPADNGFSATDAPYVPLETSPTSYEAFGISYSFYTLLPACQSKDATVQYPANTMLLYDPVGYWHGSLTPIVPRYNMLFVDGHVKNMTRSQLDGVANHNLNDLNYTVDINRNVCNF